MTSHEPNHSTRPRKSPCEIEGAHQQLVLILGALAVPAIVSVFVLKGFIPALILAGLAVGVWLQLTDMIPAPREWTSMSKPRTPLETAVLTVMGFWAASIPVLWLFGV